MTSTFPAEGVRRGAEVATARRFEQISLDELNENAALLSRTDRKYVVHHSIAERMLAELPNRVRQLDVDGRRAFDYLSTYFDTPARDCFLDAAFRRRRRCKFRTRRYLDSGRTMFEVKVKGGRGETVKHRRELDAADPTEIDDTDRRWASELVHDAELAWKASPVFTSAYRRRTFVDPDDWSRCTVDDRLRFCDLAGGSADLGEHVVIETKSTGRTGAADRWLWRNGQRPEKISKYCSAAAALDPSLPANRWSRTIRRTVRIHA